MGDCLEPMAIILPPEIQQLEIPQAIDARGTASDLGGTFTGADQIKRNQLEMARLAELDIINLNKSGQAENAGVRATGTSAVMGLDHDRAEKKAREDRRNAIDVQMLLALQNAQERSRILGQEIATLERGFEREHGDAWREIFANEILGPDETPIRGDDESLEDYRQRVEAALIDKMIDPETGEIRPEFKNHPDHAKAAEWAQKEWEKRQVDHFIDVQTDPNRSQSEKQASFEHHKTHATFNESRQVSQTETVEIGQDVTTMVAEKSDATRDRTTQGLGSGMAEQNRFLNPGQ